MAGIAYQWLANAEMPIAAMYRQLRDSVSTQLCAPNAAEAARGVGG